MEPIAIIGAGCRFPGSVTTPSKLWDLIEKPRDLTGPPPKTRFNGDVFFHADGTHHGTTNATKSYFLEEDVGHFDAAFFNIQAAEAESMDPQQRLLLEVVYDGLCAAGQSMETLRGSDTAVLVGMMCDDYNTMVRRDWETMPRYTSTGLCRAIHANRISYFFGWHGLSVTVDTACSGSMVALDQAVQALRSGRSRMAVAAGANLILTPDMSISESKLGMLSPDGHCKMWDVSANGYARGEGVACVFLKTLSQALADNDSIECIIRETAVNQDGRTPGLTMPSGVAQAALIRSCYERAGLDPIRRPQDRPQFFHAHGTGTQAGDPQEASAISKALFAEGSKDEKLAVGSIKTIIGHTEGTAGIASVIGTMLALKNRVIPQNLHFHNLNPLVAPFYMHLEIPTAAKPWMVQAGHIRRASVNSFGFGGTNAHAIMEEYIPPSTLTKQSSPVAPSLRFTPLVFSASSEVALQEMLTLHLDYFKAHTKVNYDHIAYTLQHRRSVLSARKAIVAPTVHVAIQALEKLVNNAGTNSNTKAAVADYYDNQSARFASSGTRILGMFTGQGAQWARMGAELIEASPYAQSRFTELDSCLQGISNPLERPSWTLRDQLMASKDVSRISEAEVSQPLCVAVQIILVDILRTAGVSFAAVIGHSSGEIGAAYASRLVTASDAIRIAYFRGLHAKLARNPKYATPQTSSPYSRGAMMAVGASLNDSMDFCSQEIFAGRILQVAAVNSDSSVTLSGDEDAINEAETWLKAKGKFARKLKVDTAYHSAYMKSCARPYLSSLDGDSVGAQNQAGVDSQTLWFSSVLEGEIMTDKRLTNQYWVDNMCRPVMFAGALSQAIKQAGPFDLAIEVGPHPALKGPALATAAATRPNNPIPYTCMLSRDMSDLTQLAAALGFIWTHLGAESVAFSAVEALLKTGTANPTNVSLDNKVITDLPRYPFDHRRSYWTSSRLPNQYKRRSAPNPILGVACSEAITSGEKQWRNILCPREIPWLKGHKLQGQSVFPATGYVCMAIEAMNILAFEASAASSKATNIGLLELTEVELPHAIAFDDDGDSVEIIFSLSSVARTDSSITAKWACYTASSGSDEKTVLNAKGEASCRLSPAKPDTLLPLKAQGENGNSYNLVGVGVEEFYRNLSRKGYGYSAPFQGVSTIQRRMGYSCGTLLDQSESTWENQLVIHPGLLDSALQTLFCAWLFPGDSRLWALHVPVSFSTITINPYYFSSSKATEISYETLVTNESPIGVVGDISLVHQHAGHDNNASNAAIRFEGATLTPFSPATPGNDLPMFSQYRYGIMQPDGALAAAGETLSEYEVQMFQDVDRIAYWYLRNAAAVFPPQERRELLLHFQNYLRWCDRIVSMVTENQHPKVTAACNLDTREVIDELLARYMDRDDIRFVQVVGDNLIPVFRTGSSMLEHMNKAGLLRAFYSENSICSGPTCRWLSSLVSQIAHRFPSMNILEVGAGTGATTSLVLRALGGAYASYTFTDISSAFFLPAEELFTEASAMIFKTFDMEKSPSKQGYVEGSYDVIVAVNVLHVSGDLGASLANIRRLLKPGGYLVVGELTSNDLLFTGATVGTLPGWWIGSEAGRPWGPLLSLSQWDAALRKAGFGGIDTVTPDISASLPMSAFVAQATDDRVALLRNPLGGNIHPRGIRTDSLAIVGGTTWPPYKLGQQVSEILGSRFLEKKHFDTVEKFVSSNAVSDYRYNDGSSTTSSTVAPTVLCLTDLDRPFLQDLTVDKFDALKTLLTTAGTLVWVTCGSRVDSHWSYMMTGLINTAKMELPQLHVQVLDLDSASGGIWSDTANLLAKSVLQQVALRSWPTIDKGVFGHQDGHENMTDEKLLWTSEPQVFVSGERCIIPRLVPDAEKNTRYNSRRRDIFTTVNVSSDALQLTVTGRGVYSTLELQVASPLKNILDSKRSTESIGSAQAQAQTQAICITHSLLQNVAVYGVGHMRLCMGVTLDTNDLVLAMTASSQRSISVPSDWCITQSKVGGDADMVWGRSPEILVHVAAQLLAAYILSITPAGGTLLVHDADPVAQSALRDQAIAKGVHLVLSTTDPSHQTDCDVVVLRRDLPKYTYRSVIPSSAAVYVQFHRGQVSDDVGLAIYNMLPQSCIKLSEDVIFGAEVELSRGVEGVNNHGIAARALSRAATAAVAAARRSPRAMVECIPLASAPYHKAVGETLVVVDWTADTTVVAKVQAIDAGIQFSADRTYLFIGMAGELGQSLAWWMITHGARHILLTSRNPKVNPKFAEKAAERFGATVMAMSLDITSRESLRSIHTQIIQNLPPVGGVVNGALILDDSLLVNTTLEQFERVTAPKVLGTQLLDELFGNDPSLDFFIVCSSISSVIGWSGQSNYAAANDFMTGLVAQRRRRGVAGSAINIPAVLGVGYAAHSIAFNFEAFEALGFFNISENDLHQLFAEAILSGHPKSRITSAEENIACHQVAMGVNFITHDFQVANSNKRDIKLSHFVRSKAEEGEGRSSAAENGTGPVRVRTQLEMVSAAAERDTLHDIVSDGFLTHLRRLLRVTEEERALSGNSTLVEQGVDSLVAVDIRAWFLRELNIDVPTLKVLGGGSIADLVDDALDKFINASRAAADKHRQASVSPGPTELPSVITTSRAAPFAMQDGGKVLLTTEDSSSEDAHSSSSQSAQTPMSTPADESPDLL